MRGHAMHPRKWIIGFGMITTLALLIAVTNSSVEQAVAQGQFGTVDSSHAAPWNAESIAISIPEAELQAGGQEDFMLLASLAEEASPVTFAGAEWLDSGEIQGKLWFTEVPPQKVLDAIHSLPLRVEVYTNALQSRSDVQQRLESLSAALLEVGVTGFELSTSPSLDVVYVHYESDFNSQAAPTSHDTVRAVASLHFPQNVKVEVQEVRSAGLSEQAIRGGMAMTQTSTGTATCTSGFTAFRGGQWGLLTAGHCPNATHQIVGSTYGFSFVTEHVGSYGDAQFHASTDPTRLNSIKIANSGPTYRTITSTAYPVAGASICNFGRTRPNAACTTVAAVNVCLTNSSGVAVCRLARTNGTFTNIGDSGGPWYLNNTAIGIHAGENSAGFAVFSQVGHVKAILSAEVHIG